MSKKKPKIDLDTLDFKEILEETVACSRLGRTIASFGATLTGREKQGANLTYLLLSADRPLPERTPTTAKIDTEKKRKEYTYAQAVKWFAEKYPNEAQPLLKRLKEEYDIRETLVLYGVQDGKDLPDKQYIDVLTNILQIPEHDAAVMYHGAIKPQFERVRKEEGIVRVVMK